MRPSTNESLRGIRSRFLRCLMRGIGVVCLIPAQGLSQVREAGHATVTATALNLRSSPSASSRVLARLPQGAAVEVDSVVNGWAAVRRGELEGFARAEYLQVSESSAWVFPILAGVATLVIVGGIFLARRSGTVSCPGCQQAVTPATRFSREVDRWIGSGTMVTLARTSTSELRPGEVWPTRETGWVSQNVPTVVTRVLIEDTVACPRCAHEWTSQRTVTLN
jgi:uncharacterized protein YgiM (DUF1202 family)